jgi:hypothetical protein
VRVALDTQLAVGTATGIGVYQRDLARALVEIGVEVRALRFIALDPWRFDRRVIWDQALLPILALRSGADVLHAASPCTTWRGCACKRTRGRTRAPTSVR